MSELSKLHDETALVENTAEFISNYLQNSLSYMTVEGETIQGPHPDMVEMLTDISVFMFEAGAQWADNTAGREEKSIIIPGGE